MKTRYGRLKFIKEYRVVRASGDKIGQVQNTVGGFMYRDEFYATATKAERKHIAAFMQQLEKGE